MRGGEAGGGEVAAVPAQAVVGGKRTVRVDCRRGNKYHLREFVGQVTNRGYIYTKPSRPIIASSRRFVVPSARPRTCPPWQTNNQVGVSR
jgi:hypothetical protein